MDEAAVANGLTVRVGAANSFIHQGLSNQSDDKCTDIGGIDIYSVI
jgi:hypothetical protein